MINNKRWNCWTRIYAFEPATTWATQWNTILIFAAMLHATTTESTRAVTCQCMIDLCELLSHWNCINLRQVSIVIVIVSNWVLAPPIRFTPFIIIVEWFCVFFSICKIPKAWSRRGWSDPMIFRNSFSSAIVIDGFRHILLIASSHFTWNALQLN